MKRFPQFLIPVAAMLFALGCETNDVDGDSSGTIDPDRYFMLTDAAFGEFLEYNSLYQTSTNSLPPGIAFASEDGSAWYLNKSVAATVTGRVYLTQSAANIASLQEKGYSGAKITNIDGIQFFVNATEIYMTDCDVAGALDLTALTHLKALQARRNYINGVSLPASIEDLRIEPKSGATDQQKLTALDISHCAGINNILLDGALIPKAALLTPVTPTAASIVASLTGASGRPYPCTQAFFDKLADATSKSFFTVPAPPVPPDPYELSDVNFALYLKYNAEEAGSLPEGLIIDGEGADAGKYFLDKNLTAGVTVIDIHQNGSWDTPVIAAGYTIAKITNVDGMQFFTDATSIDMTSTQVTGALDLSMLTALTDLKMNNSYCSSLSLPASIVNLSCNASTVAAAGKFTSIDFSACDDLASATLTGHNIVKATGFIAPTAPAKSGISITLTGTDYVTTVTFYNKLNTASKAFFTDPNPAPVGDPFSIVWTATATTKSLTLWDATSSLPSLLTGIGITSNPQLFRGSGFSSTTSSANVFGGLMGSNTSGDADDALTNGHYLTLTVVCTTTPITFSGITSNFRRSASGASSCIVEYSLNGGVSFTAVQTLSTTSGLTNDTSSGNAVSIDLSSAASLKGVVNTTVVFRFVAYGNSGNGGFYIVNGDTPLTLSGTTPKP